MPEDGPSNESQIPIPNRPADITRSGLAEFTSSLRSVIHSRLQIISDGRLQSENVLVKLNEGRFEIVYDDPGVEAIPPLLEGVVDTDIPGSDRPRIITEIGNHISLTNVGDVATSISNEQLADVSRIACPQHPGDVLNLGQLVHPNSIQQLNTKGEILVADTNQLQTMLQSSRYDPRVQSLFTTHEEREIYRPGSTDDSLKTPDEELAFLQRMAQTGDTIYLLPHSEDPYRYTPVLAKRRTVGAHEGLTESTVANNLDLELWKSFFLTAYSAPYKIVDGTRENILGDAQKIDGPSGDLWQESHEMSIHNHVSVSAENRMGYQAALTVPFEFKPGQDYAGVAVPKLKRRLVPLVMHPSFNSTAINIWVHTCTKEAQQPKQCLRVLVDIQVPENLAQTAKSILA